MKTIMFRLEIDTEDKISSDDEINEMSEKIAEALSNHCNNSESGIVPDNSETYVKMIRVTGWYSDKTAIEHP